MSIICAYVVNPFSGKLDRKVISSIYNKFVYYREVIIAFMCSIYAVLYMIITVIKRYWVPEWNFEGCLSDKVI